MNFRIADTFTDSLAKLTGEEQKAVKSILKVETNSEIRATLSSNTSAFRQIRHRADAVKVIYYLGMR